MIEEYNKILQVACVVGFISFLIGLGSLVIPNLHYMIGFLPIGFVLLCSSSVYYFILEKITNIRSKKSLNVQVNHIVK